MLATGLGPVRSGRIVGFDISSLNHWCIYDSRRSVSDQRGVHRHAAIEHHLLTERHADPLDDAAVHLPIEGQGIDDPADVLNHHYLENTDMSRRRVNLHLGGLGTKPVGGCIIAVTGLWIRARHIHVIALFDPKRAHLCRRIREVDTTGVVGTKTGYAVGEHDVVGRDRPQAG